MAWIRTIEPEDATGELAEAYAWQAKRLGRPTEFTQLGSLAPELVHARLAIYRATDRTPSSLTAAQRVLVAYVTAVVNETPHCQAQTRVVMVETGFTDSEIAAVDAGRYEVLSAADRALARYARTLTRDPGAISEADIDGLRAHGFGDEEVLDANNQCAHANYVNRIANGLGLKTTAVDHFPAFAAVPR
jgi:uncharacterized peroxidase-related enzyme